MSTIFAKLTGAEFDAMTSHFLASMFYPTVTAKRIEKLKSPSPLNSCPQHAFQVPS